MKKILLGIVIALVFIFSFRYCESIKKDRTQLMISTTLIQKELNNVGKLIVTEGSYSLVSQYDMNQEKLFGFYNARKSAVVLVNAKATLSFDLRKVETEIDELTKTVRITKIPEPELSIYPDIEYYKIDQGYLNNFDASDHNTISKQVMQALKKEIEKSELRANAENRLITELSKIYILTHSMGWTLVYENSVIEKEEDLKDLRL